LFDYSIFFPDDTNIQPKDQTKYLKIIKTSQLTNKDSKKDLSDAESLTNNDQFVPDIKTLQILFKILTKMNEKKQRVFRANDLRRSFDRITQKKKTDGKITQNKIINANFKFFNENCKTYIALTSSKTALKDIKRNKNSMLVEFKSIEDVKNLLVKLKNDYNISLTRGIHLKKWRTYFSETFINS